MGNGAQRVWGTRDMDHMGNGVLGVWGIWEMRPSGGMGYRGMGHVDNGIHGQWGTGVWDTWGKGAMGDLLPKYQKDVNLSKRCQLVKKMSNVKK